MWSAAINIANTACKRRELFKHSTGYYSLKYRLWGKESPLSISGKKPPL